MKEMKICFKKHRVLQKKKKYKKVNKENLNLMFLKTMMLLLAKKLKTLIIKLQKIKLRRKNQLQIFLLKVIIYMIALK